MPHTITAFHLGCWVSFFITAITNTLEKLVLCIFLTLSYQKHFPCEPAFITFSFSFPIDGVFGRCQELASADLYTSDISSSALQRLRILLQKLAHRGTLSVCLSVFCPSFFSFSPRQPLSVVYRAYSESSSAAIARSKPNKSSCLFGWHCTAPPSLNRSFDSYRAIVSPSSPISSSQSNWLVCW